MGTIQSTAVKRVFLLDDHEIVRRGMRELLSSAEDLEVVGESASAVKGVELIAELKPDVAVLDVRLPDGNGVEVCRDVRSRLPETACLMLTSFADDDALFGAVVGGAAGYFVKQVNGADLVDAVRRVGSGESLIDPAIATKALSRLQSETPADPLAVLTVQERRIVGYIADGMTNRQIGEAMFLAEKTVKNYVSSLLAKLGMQRRAEAAALAAREAERKRTGSSS